MHRVSHGPGLTQLMRIPVPATAALLEVTRYLGADVSACVSKAVLLGVIPPFLLQTDENPKGVPGGVFDGIKQAILADRYAYFDAFFADFYNTDVLAPERIGEAAASMLFMTQGKCHEHATPDRAPGGRENLNGARGPQAA